MEPSILISLSMHPSVQHTPSIHQYNVRSSVHLTICPRARLFIHPSPIHCFVCKLFHRPGQPVSQPANQPTNGNNNWASKNTVFDSFYHVPNIRFIYSLNVKFRSVMSTVQRNGNHRSLKKKTILNMQRFTPIRVTTYMSQVISKYTEYYVIIATCMLPRLGGCGA